MCLIRFFSLSLSHRFRMDPSSFRGSIQFSQLHKTLLSVLRRRRPVHSAPPTQCEQGLLIRHWVQSKGTEGCNKCFPIPPQKQDNMYVQHASCSFRNSASCTHSLTPGLESLRPCSPASRLPGPSRGDTVLLKPTLQ